MARSACTVEVAEAMRCGAHFFLPKPIDPVLLRKLILELITRQELRNQLRQALELPEEVFGLLGNSPGIRLARERIRRVARLPVTVLISGETGTGKELVARAIHEQSSRNRGPFVAVNCSAIPADLLESEFFGHEKGAFTGAVASVSGRLEAADGGTLFLDEVSELPLALQAKLLRVLESKSVERLGSAKAREFDFRVLAASNTRLSSLVEGGRFRRDLFYRINGFEITLPALRDRLEDLPFLLQHFSESVARRFSREVRGFSRPALRVLEQHRWPGNVRELMHVVETAVICSDGEVIEAWDLPFNPNGCETSRTNGESVLRRTEINILSDALQQANGNRSAAARNLGITRSQVRYRIKKYGLGA